MSSADFDKSDKELVNRLGSFLQRKSMGHCRSNRRERKDIFFENCLFITLQHNTQQYFSLRRVAFQRLTNKTS